VEPDCPASAEILVSLGFLAFGLPSLTPRAACPVISSPALPI